MTGVVSLDSVSARGAGGRGRPRPVLSRVTLGAGREIVAVVGRPSDGTSLLFDVLEGAARPSAGQVVAGRRVARVSLDAPLPDALRVDEVCALSARLRDEPAQPAAERLSVLDAGALANRAVRTLRVSERRTIALAIALTSSADVVLVEEPFVAIEPAAAPRVEDALRARAGSAAVLVTTASPKDAVRLGDRVGLLDAGAFAWLRPEEARLRVDDAGVAALAVVLRARRDAVALAQALGMDDAVTRVENASYAGAGALVVVEGPALGPLARAVTHAAAAHEIEVERIEPRTASFAALRAKLAAEAAR